MNLAIPENKLIDVCKKNDIVFLAVFGSFVEIGYTTKSDIDLLARFSKPKSLIDMVRIERDLSQLLGRDVDLLTESAISPYLRDRIRRGMRVIYEKKR